MHWQHAKGVLKYLKAFVAVSYRLTYIKDDLDIVGYVDVDWASNTVDKRSYIGFCFKLSGAIISHEYRKQQTVALSSTEPVWGSVKLVKKQYFLLFCIPIVLIIIIIYFLFFYSYFFSFF